MLRKWVISFILFSLAVLVFGGGLARRANGAEPTRIAPPPKTAQGKPVVRGSISLPCGCRWYEHEDGSRTAEKVEILAGPDTNFQLTVVYVQQNGKRSQPRLVDEELIETRKGGCPDFSSIPKGPNLNAPGADESGVNRDNMGRVKQLQRQPPPQEPIKDEPPH